VVSGSPATDKSALAAAVASHHSHSPKPALGGRGGGSGGSGEDEHDEDASLTVPSASRGVASNGRTRTQHQGARPQRTVFVSTGHSEAATARIAQALGLYGLSLGSSTTSSMHPHSQQQQPNLVTLLCAPATASAPLFSRTLAPFIALELCCFAAKERGEDVLLIVDEVGAAAASAIDAKEALLAPRTRAPRSSGSGGGSVSTQATAARSLCASLLDRATALRGNKNETGGSGGGGGGGGGSVSILALLHSAAPASKAGGSEHNVDNTAHVREALESLADATLQLLPTSTTNYRRSNNHNGGKALTREELLASVKKKSKDRKKHMTGEEERPSGQVVTGLPRRGPLPDLLSTPLCVDWDHAFNADTASNKTPPMFAPPRPPPSSTPPPALPSAGVTEPLAVLGSALRRLLRQASELATSAEMAQSMGISLAEEDPASHALLLRAASAKELLCQASALPATAGVALQGALQRRQKATPEAWPEAEEATAIAACLCALASLSTTTATAAAAATTKGLLEKGHDSGGGGDRWRALAQTLIEHPGFLEEVHQGISFAAAEMAADMHAAPGVAEAIVSRVEQQSRRRPRGENQGQHESHFEK